MINLKSFQDLELNFQIVKALCDNGFKCVLTKGILSIRFDDADRLHQFCSINLPQLLSQPTV